MDVQHRISRTSVEISFVGNTIIDLSKSESVLVNTISVMDKTGQVGGPDMDLFSQGLPMAMVTPTDEWIRDEENLV